MLEFTDINKSLPNGQNMGGLTQEIYYCFHADVLTWPTAPVAAATITKMWTQYFNFIKLRRGRVIVPVHGEIDFSRDDISIEICKELYDKDFPYLELTELGKLELFKTLGKSPLPKQEKIHGKKKL